MSDVTPRLRETVDCPCGCGRHGTAKRNGHVQRCDPKVCQLCRNGSNSRRGRRKQASAVTMIGIPRSRFSPSNEETLPGHVRVEVKSGKTLAGPVWTKYLASEAQSEALRPYGDTRPFVALFMPEGTKDGLIVFRLSKLDDVLVALAEQRGLTA